LHCIGTEIHRRQKDVECCEQAIKTIDKFETMPSYKSISSTHQSSSTIINPRTIMKWFHAFCSNNESFMNVMSRHSQKTKYPPLLDANRHFKDELLQFAKNNLSTMRVELMHNHVHEVMLPDLLQK
jgi:hypothetical protein